MNVAMVCPSCSNAKGSPGLVHQPQFDQVREAPDGKMITYPSYAQCTNDYHKDFTPPVALTSRGSGFDSHDLRGRAREWLRTHPIAAAYFERFALEKLAKKKKFGIAALTERVRWECDTGEEKEEGFKVSNDYRAYIARWLIEKHPELNDYLTLRDVKY